MIHDIDRVTRGRAGARVFGRAFAATRHLVSLAAVCLLLVGCASTPKLGDDARAQLTQVQMAPIATPPEMYYLGPGSGVGMMFGAVGGLITAVANQSPGERLAKFAQDNGIHIDQIVKEEAAKALQQAGKINLTDAPGANAATLKITIVMYGFSIPNGFSGDLVPIVSLKCELVDPSGKVLWSANDHTLTLGNPAEGKTPDEFRANPKLIEESWRTAVRSIMTNIASHM